MRRGAVTRVKLLFACSAGFGLSLCAREAAATTGSSKSCVEVSSVVGEQRCSRYGSSWSVERLPPVVARIGLRAAQMSPDGMEFTGRIGKEGPVKYSYRGESAGVSSFRALGLDVGFGGFIHGQLYAGIDAAYLIGHSDGKDFSVGDYHLGQRGGLDLAMVTLGGHAGYRVPLGLVSLRGEVFTGAAWTRLTHHVTGRFASRTNITSIALRPIVEPRVALDIWSTPNLSWSAYVGMDVLHARGYAVGVAATWHMQAFDGQFALW